MLRRVLPHVPAVVKVISDALLSLGCGNREMDCQHDEHYIDSPSLLLGNRVQWVALAAGKDGVAVPHEAPPVALQLVMPHDLQAREIASHPGFGFVVLSHAAEEIRD